MYIPGLTQYRGICQWTSYIQDNWCHFIRELSSRCLKRVWRDAGNLRPGQIAAQMSNETYKAVYAELFGRLLRAPFDSSTSTKTCQLPRAVRSAWDVMIILFRAKWDWIIWVLRCLTSTTAKGWVHLITLKQYYYLHTCIDWQPLLYGLVPRHSSLHASKSMISIINVH